MREYMLLVWNICMARPENFCRFDGKINKQCLLLTECFLVKYLSKIEAKACKLLPKQHDL